MTDRKMETAPPSTTDDVVLGLTLSVALALGLRFLDVSYDDAYITYRYARNLAEGHGFVYNVGLAHLGTTTPLYTLLLAGLACMIEIPVASGLLSIASVLVAIVSVEGIGRLHGIRFGGSITAAFLVAEPEIYRIFGGETLFVQLGLLPSALLFHLRGARRTAALLFGLAILARMDAIIFVGLVYAWDAWSRGRPPWREVAGVGLVLLPWIAWASWTFGSPLPGTLGAKIAQGQAGGWKLFFEGAQPYLAGLNAYREPLRWFFIPVLALGLWQIIVRERVWLYFLLATLVHAFAYQFALRASFSHWYLAGFYLTNALTLAAGLRFLTDRPARRRQTGHTTWPLGSAIAATALVGLLLSAIAPLARHPIHSARRELYSELGEWLRLNTDTEASVAYFEIGYLGYYSRRTIIDPVGLVTPGGLERIGRGELFWFFDDYEPDYYIHNTNLGGAFVRGPWFRTHYAPVRSFAQRGFPGDLVLYRRL